MPLIGKTVKTSNIDLVKFFYPTFVESKEPYYDYESDILYTGSMKPDLLSNLRAECGRFINTIGVPDYDLDDKETLIKVVYQKWGREPKKEVLDYLLSLKNTDEFLKYIKKYWVVGKSAIDDADVEWWKYYKCLGKSTHNLLIEYLKLREVYSCYVIMSRTMDFFSYVLNPSEIPDDKSGIYRNTVKEFSVRWKPILKSLLYTVYTMEGSMEYRFVWLLLNISRGKL